MREILFRGKDPENGVWYEGQYIHLHKTTYCFREDYDSFPNNDIHQIVFERMTDWGLPNQHLRADVGPATVGQYTGLTDKNGVKIFEGDIVRYGDTIHEVVFEQRNKTAYFGLVYGPMETLPFGHYQDLRQITVIGNIHDNPDLLTCCDNS